jgi:hypothetical protein
MNCDHCHTPIETQSKLKIAIKPFKYLHFHTECYIALANEGKPPLVLPENAIQSLALSTLIPGIVLLAMPLLADLFNGGAFDPIDAYGKNIIIAMLGVLTILFSATHWREVFKISSAFRARPSS